MLTCGGLIDLMKQERELSTTHHPFLLQRDLSRTRGFQGPPLCLASIDLDMPWLGGTFCFCFLGTETSGKTMGKTLGKTEGNSV